MLLGQLSGADMPLIPVVLPVLCSVVAMAAGVASPAPAWVLRANLERRIYRSDEPVVLEVVLENHSDEDARGPWLRLGESLVWEVRKVYTAKRIRLAGEAETEARGDECRAAALGATLLLAGQEITVSFLVAGRGGAGIEVRPPLPPGRYWIAVRHRAPGRHDWRFPLVATVGPFEVVGP